MHRKYLPRSKITKLLVNLEVSVSLATMGSSILAPTLVVRGPSDLNVKVKVTPVEFLDWTMPEVTVYTTKIETSFEIEVLP